MSLTRVLFLCTGNACRSQMAEGYAKVLGTGLIEAQSAGLEAHDKNPRAIAVMAEDGVDIVDQSATRLTDEMLHWADLVITVCGHADEHCPLLPSGTRKEHWPLEDPAKAEGSEAEIMAEFRRVRDEVKERVRDRIQLFKMEAAE
jgi:arsenate reductase